MLKVGEAGGQGSGARVRTTGRLMTQVKVALKVVLAEKLKGADE